MKPARLVPLLLALAAPGAVAQGYVVAAGFPAGDAFDDAAAKLAAHRKADVVRFDPADLAGLESELRRRQPATVGVVIRPEHLEWDFARRFLSLASRIDDDPFTDFEYGFLTGGNAEEAMAFVSRSIAAGVEPRDPSIASLGVWGIKKSQEVSQPFAVRKRRIPRVEGRIADAKHFPEEGRDLGFIREFLPKLAGRSIVELGGHGYPREIVGGPRWSDLVEADLAGAVVLNIACYTAVTGTWYEDDWGAGVVRKREIPPEESFGLQVLRRGAAGYTAYLCPRPAGPELACDLAALAVEGMSLGEARRRDYDKLVLGFLAAGRSGLELKPVRDGDPVRRPADVVADLMLEMGTGGIVFGDPALRPFAGDPGGGPVEVSVGKRSGGIEVEAELQGGGIFLYATDPTTSWDGKGEPAMKIVARVPVGDRFVAAVKLEDVVYGKKALPARLVWAVEEDHGRRFVHLKALFQRVPMPGNLTARWSIRLTEDPVAAARSGVDPPAAPGK